MADKVATNETHLASGESFLFFVLIGDHFSERKSEKAFHGDIQSERNEITCTCFGRQMLLFGLNGWDVMLLLLLLLLLQLLRLVCAVVVPNFIWADCDE